MTQMRYDEYDPAPRVRKRRRRRGGYRVLLMLLLLPLSGLCEGLEDFSMG